MNVYRNLLWWLALAALGALAWELLAPDLGEVVVRWHGRTLSTTVAFALVAWGLLWFGAWALWWLARLPFDAWHRLAQKQARQRLINGLEALHEGRWWRAETLLGKAAADHDARTAALLAAREAALQRDDPAAAALLQTQLAQHAPVAAALNSAAMLLAQGHGDEALTLLLPIAEKKALPPRGQQQLLAALAASGRAAEAMDRLPTVRKELALPESAFATLECRLAADCLRQSATADDLTRRWQDAATRLRDQPMVIRAYVETGQRLGLETEVATALHVAIDRQWNEELVALYGRLSNGGALTGGERWLAGHSTSPVLLVALGRLCREQQLHAKAEDYLHRAIAQGGGGEAWEQLGHVFTAQNQSESAQTCYANALRVGRGELAVALGGRTLRDQIAAEAVIEQRNEHGLPLLPR